MAKEPAPWDRQEEETPKQYEAFCVYRDLKDPLDPTSKRSVPQVAEKLNKSEGLLYRWSMKNEWVSRVNAWDEEQEKITREAQRKEQIEEIRKMRKRHADLGNAILIKAAKALKIIPAEEIKPSDLTRMVDVASKLERISRGDVGEVVEERQGESVAPAVQFYLPDNGRDKLDGEDLEDVE